MIRYFFPFAGVILIYFQGGDDETFAILLENKAKGM